MLFDLLKDLLFSGKSRASQGPVEPPPAPAAPPVSHAPLQYDPSCFRVEDIDTAKAIILTPEGIGTETRWRTETPVIVDNLAKELALQEGQLLIDFGCGIGRIAKELIERFNVTVLGVDISDSMRRLAVEYVGSDEHFLAVSPAVAERLISGGLAVDGAYSVWVLQHCAAPKKDIALLRKAMRPGGRFHLVNNRYRAVPTNRGWVDDGQNIRSMVGEAFSEVNYFKLPAEAGSSQLTEYTYCATFVAEPAAEDRGEPS